MVLHPEVQTAAQSEIDATIGSSRLPSLIDRPHLPYIDAIVSEVLRHSQPSPLGVPHRVRCDDTHGGYFIPKDSLVIPNIW
jgi:cytochrome P450